ncbi:putative bifunctional diguanylate cyclase/phosphodiesterase [Hoeflea alexandrii]|uniref:putative bifunctional diguanylate cyclase/phosphodiesterase n=1 Tax=Hoeflea alexandrii TaxID=288436 RepID=UPI0022AFAF3A|nr:GGDEF and EAL domain-containing protein [Hoeflea alexandrii]MCZ4289680.1 EAL domain-containing protein [Hoeflea alexandrii]
MKKASGEAVDGRGKKNKPAATISRPAQIDRLLSANATVQMDAVRRAAKGQGADAAPVDADAERVLFRAMIDQVPDYLFVKDTASRFVIANRAVAADLGRKPDELIGLTDFSFHPSKHAHKFYADEQELMRTGEALIDIEDLIIDPDGKEKWFATSKVPLRDDQNRIIGLVGVCRDITDRKHAEAQIHFMALHDSLTGLPNRTLFMDRLTQGILLSDRTGQRITVIFIDLDNFKTVNDSLGHDAGDTLLKVVAERMTTAVRASDTVARMGGDEFVILLADQAENASTTSAILEKIRAAIAEPIEIKRQSFRVTGSIGVAGYPEHGTDAETLLLNADIAMYEAKAKGRDNLQLYTKGIDDAARERRLLQDHLLAAISNKEFSLLYQPQIDLGTGRIFAVEALVRWNHPALGEISPGKFIPLAEENRLIVPLGNWVLREACRQNKAWQDAGLDPITVCVNVSARQMSEAGWVGQVTGILLETGLEPRYLELELTESMLMHDVNQAVDVMTQLQALGVNFAIDDFGTGYSSLSALKNFPVIRLKIDQSFIANLTSDPDDQNIAKAVILLGQNLNMRVIAEGVETEEQLAFLREHHCDEAQGYHFSRPVQPDAIVALLRAGTAIA